MVPFRPYREVLAAAREAGCLSIMAHPYLVADTVTCEGRALPRYEYILALQQAGLQGIETSYTYDKTSYDGHLTPEKIETEVRETFGGLFPVLSGGSDYHADHRKGTANARLPGERGISLDDFMLCPALRAASPACAIGYWNTSVGGNNEPGET